MRPLPLVLLLCAVSACAPPEPELFPRRHEPDSYLRELQTAGSIRIAVAEDAPPLGYAGRSGRPQGLTVALGRMIAEALHVTPEFHLYPSQRLSGLVAVGGADVAFPLAPITEEVVRKQSVSDPYLVAHQRLLVELSSAVDHVDELAGSRVCAYVDPSTAVDIEELAPGVSVTASDDLAGCGARLATGRVEAVTADDFLLDHLGERLRASGGPPTRLTGERLSTVGYGARVVDRPGLAQFVSDVFAAAEQDGRWQDAYARWVGDPPEQPPTMTVWEAAALWPRDV